MKKFLNNLAGLFILFIMVLSFSLITFPTLAQNSSQCQSVCIRYQDVIDQLQNATEKNKAILLTELKTISTEMRRLHCKCLLQ